jgi:hypothetical protein
MSSDRSLHAELLIVLRNNVSRVLSDMGI